jgi:hypothetical protein
VGWQDEESQSAMGLQLQYKDSATGQWVDYQELPLGTQTYQHTQVQARPQAVVGASG